MKLILLFLGLSFILSAKTQTIVFGAGCFWGVEKHFENMRSVTSATAGYAGGDYPDPTYEKVLAHRKNHKVKNHAEVVKVVYDDTKISTKTLIKSFWELHDPTQGERKGNDAGNNYRLALYYSGTGWLSFFKPAGDSVIFKEDNSYGMHRIEVIAKKSGAHPGHLFDDAPVLEFVPREKLKAQEKR